MNPTLLHICGPFSIHAYGFFCALGVFITLSIARYDKKLQKIISFADFITSIEIMVLSGYLGGKLLTVISEDFKFENLVHVFKFWESGLSIQGTMIGIIVALFVYLKIKKISFFLFVDRIALYAPLVQTFGRIGCFFAGCCYGKIFNNWWSVTYNHPDHLAPLGIALHPSQLYSAGLLFLIFLFLYFYLQNKITKPGILFFSYLVLVSMERFMIDFFRSDQIWFESNNFLQYFSINQWISLGIISFGILGILAIKYKKLRK